MNEMFLFRPVGHDRAIYVAQTPFGGSDGVRLAQGSTATATISRHPFIDRDLETWLVPIADSARSSVDAVHSWIGVAPCVEGGPLSRFPCSGFQIDELSSCACLAISDELICGPREDVKGSGASDAPRFLARSVCSCICELHEDDGAARNQIVVCRAEYLSKTVGALVTHFSEGVLPTNQSIAILESLAEQAGVLIGTHTLLQQTKERHRELEAINMIAEELSGSQDLRTKFDNAMDKVLEIVAADGGMIYLVDRTTGELNVIVRRGVPSYAVSEADRLAVGEGVSGWVVSQRKPVLLFDVAHDARLSVRWMAAEGVKCLAVVPIMARGEALGTLCAFTYDVRVPTSERVRLLCAVGHQMGIAVENHDLTQDAVALQAERVTLLRERLIRVTRAHEEERSKLARELHDQVAQGLVSSIVALRAVSTQVERDPELATSQIKVVGDTLSETLQKSREIILDLRSTLGEKKAFVEAVREDLLAKAGNESGALCSFESTNWPNDLAADVSVNLYRIVQEALTNATRHGKPRHIWLKLRCIRKRTLEIVVADDGSGFDPLEGDELTPSSGHMGLLGMRERAGLMQGTLEITSSPMSGTTVKVAVPWKWAMTGEDMQ